MKRKGKSAGLIGIEEMKLVAIPLAVVAVFTAAYFLAFSEVKLVKGAAGCGAYRGGDPLI